MPVLSALNVLVVEDEFLIAVDFEDMLRSLGAETVLLAHSVPDALAALQKPKRPDCALVDFGLGAQTAEPVADALLAHGIPFIFVTGYEEKVSMPKRLLTVPVAHKPAGIADLTAAFDLVLGRLRT